MPEFDYDTSDMDQIVGSKETRYVWEDGHYAVYPLSHRNESWPMQYAGFLTQLRLQSRAKKLWQFNAKPH